MRAVLVRAYSGYRTAIGAFAASRPGAWVLRHVLPTLDRVVVAVTGGRVTFTEHVVPTLMLTTTGRRSGRPSEKPLCFVRDGRDLVVVGTNWGQADHPAWTANLLAEPRGVVLVGGRRTEVRAALVEGAEWEGLYGRFESMLPNYVAYRRWIVGRTPRMFRLTPL